MKRKTNIDRPHLSSQEITSRQDFSSLMKQLPKATKPPLYKSGWFITTVASVAGIAVITTNFILNDETSTLNSNQPISINSEAPPTGNSGEIANVSSIDPKPTDLKISFAAEIDHGLSASSEDVTQKKQPSSQQIELYIKKYEEEMMNAKIAYEKAVDVRVQFEKNLPVKPVSNGNPDRQFVLDVNPKDFPELALYNDLLFEVEANDPNFSPTVYQEEWEDIQLKSKESGKTYYLSLFRGNISKTFSVFPVFSGANFEIANQAYLIKLANYQKELQVLKKNENAFKIEYEKATNKLDDFKNQETNLSKTN